MTKDRSRGILKNCDLATVYDYEQFLERYASIQTIAYIPKFLGDLNGSSGETRPSYA